MESVLTKEAHEGEEGMECKGSIEWVEINRIIHTREFLFDCTELSSIHGFYDLRLTKCPQLRSNCEEWCTAYIFEFCKIHCKEKEGR